MITRRSLFGILAGAVAAPIVVREGLIMPVKALAVPEYALVTESWVYVDFPARSGWFRVVAVNGEHIVEPQAYQAIPFALSPQLSALA